MEKGPGHRDYTGAKYGMWFFLFTELLFFGGLFMFYSIFRGKFPLDFHAAAREENLVLGSVNTAVLLTSSLLIALSISAVRTGKGRLSALLQAGTVALGIVFLVIKYFEWSGKIVRGLYPNSSLMLTLPKGEILFFSLYYVMTGIHGLHVLIGIIVICFMIFFTARGNIGKENFTKLENTGLFWHFVDIVWIYLFPLFYLVT